MSARLDAALRELAEAIREEVRAELAPTRETAPVELLSVAEFARRSSVGRSTAYACVADGTVASVKVRGRRLVPATEITRIAGRAS